MTAKRTVGQAWMRTLTSTEGFVEMRISTGQGAAAAKRWSGMSKLMLRPSVGPGSRPVYSGFVVGCSFLIDFRMYISFFQTNERCKCK